MPDSLYDTDLLAWSRTQGDRLRRLAAGERVNDVDWPNVIEEIESLGRSELKTVRSLLRNAVLHALKVAAWPAHSAARHWRNECDTFLSDARDRLEPGMRQWLDLERLYFDALRQARRLDMDRPGEVLPEACPLTADDVMDGTCGPDEIIARLRAGLERTS